ncbi:MAG: hypothetical protein ACREJB_05080 [Planctomycetaceae bacterium]
MQASHARIQWLTAGLLTLAVLLIAGCEDDPPTMGEIVLSHRPDTIDQSLIESFSCTINGVDAVNAIPAVTTGSEVEWFYVFEPKPGALQKGQFLHGKIRYRKLVDGKADWSDKGFEAKRQQWFRGGTTESRKNAVTAHKVNLEPGDYELRFYAFRTSPFNPAELPAVYYFGEGRLKVLPATETATTNEQ